MSRFGIHLKEISLELAGRMIFDKLSLQLGPTQWHCVLGRSGVGKSSLLRIVAGLQLPNSGQVCSENGQPIVKHVAHMSQEDGLLPWLSVLDNVRLGPRLRGSKIADYAEPALHLLEKVGLVDWSSALPARLSGGMRQRVALARTLLEERSVVLMDEPFSRLDAITRRDLQALAFSLLADRTVILVTHDPHEALRIGHTLTVLNPQLPGGLSTQVLPGHPIREFDDPTVTRFSPTLWQALQEGSGSA